VDAANDEEQAELAAKLNLSRSHPAMMSRGDLAE